MGTDATAYFYFSCKPSKKASALYGNGLVLCCRIAFSADKACEVKSDQGQTDELRGRIGQAADEAKAKKKMRTA